MSAAENLYDKNLSIGLGDAIERLVNLHTKTAGGFATPDEQAERTMLLTALNVIPLDLNFSCSIAQAPATLADDVAMFAKSASTSCCRLVPPEPVHAKHDPSPASKPQAPTQPKKPDSKPTPAASGLASMFTMPKLGSRR